MKNLLALLLCVACTQAPAPQTPTAAPIKFDALKSACANFAFADRGRAPEGFVLGMAGMFAEHCHDKARPLGPATKDALASYGLQPSMLDTYTLLIGLGMRESSGKYCEGRDLSAGNVKADEAEAGMFQASWNSSAADQELRDLFNRYSADPTKCQLTLFAQGVSCALHDAVNYGTGTGLAYQKLAKSCPAFAVEYATVLIRVLKAHFGPLVRKEAEVVPACREMLEKACS